MGDWYIVPPQVPLDKAFPEVTDRSRVIRWEDFQQVDFFSTAHYMPGIYSNSKWVGPVVDTPSLLLMLLNSRWDRHDMTWDFEGGYWHCLRCAWCVWPDGYDVEPKSTPMC